MTEQPELPPGWRVTGPSGEIIQQADGPIAAEMTGTSDSNGGEHDGSDRSGSSKPDS